MKSKIQQRFRDHLMAKGKLPKADADVPMMAHGGMIDDEFDGDWNQHDKDTSGEDEEFDTANGFAFGGEIKAPEHGDEGSPEMSDKEVQQHLAKALMRRKQLSGISR